MVDKKNSSASRFREKNESIFIGGCSCHLAHIAASNGNDAFSNYVGLNVEDVMVDLYYWVEKSAKRKGKLKEYFEFCNQDYQDLLKHLFHFTISNLLWSTFKENFPWMTHSFVRPFGSMFQIDCKPDGNRYNFSLVCILISWLKFLQMIFMKNSQTIKFYVTMKLVMGHGMMQRFLMV